MNRPAKRGAGLRRLLPISVMAGAMLCAASGCASDKGKAPTTRPMTMRERQDAALRDPMNYKPDMGRDVSGGDIGDLDRDGLKKDLHNVFNP